MRRLHAILIMAALTAPAYIRSEEKSPSPVAARREAIRFAQAGKLDEAEDSLRVAIERVEARTGRESASFGYHQIGLGGLLARKREFAEAADCAATAIPILEKELGKESIYAMSARWLGAHWALEAGQAGRAADWLESLHATFAGYVSSGRAQRAAWEEIPILRQLIKMELPRLNESGVAMVAALRGRSLVDAGRFDEALPVLDEAERSLEKLFGQGHPELVRVSEAVGEVARACEEQGIRHYVGSLGRIRRIEFAGNETFSADDLRKALAKDLPIIFASHPSERFDKFLPLIAERLRLGYRSVGFREPKVDCTHRVDEKSEAILVTIVEGPRYRQGGIRVEGGKGIDSRRLVDALSGEAEPDRLNTAAMVRRIRKAMAGLKELLPEPETRDIESTAAKSGEDIPGSSITWKSGSPNQPGEMPDTGEMLLEHMFSSPDSEEPDWRPGKPIPFREGASPPLATRIGYRLAEQGWPLARFTTSFDFRPDGTADLIIAIKDPGREALLGRVKVMGADRNSEEDIRKASGLAPGQPVRPRQIDEAMLALWKTGRFVVFEIDMQPRGGDSPEVDFHIRVCEVEKAPLLSASLSPEQEAIQRFINWLNRGMDGEELLLELDGFAGQDMNVAIGWSPRGDILFDGISTESGRGLAIGASNEGSALLVRNAGKPLPATLDFVAGGAQINLHIMPDDTGRRMRITWGAGLSSLKRNPTGWADLELVITPALPLYKADLIRRDGDTVVFDDTLRIDLETARPVDLRGGSIEIREGCVAERIQALRREIASAGSGNSAEEWWEAITALMELTGFEELLPGNADDKDTSLDVAHRAAQLLDLLAERGALEPLFDWLAGKDDEKEPEPDNFTIPLDPSSLTGGSTFAVLAGLGYLWMVEEHLPDVEWLADFSRELLFMLGGRTQHTREVMSRLLEDPTIGPYSSVLCARLLSKLDPLTANRFLMKARQQCTADAFRHDWQTVLLLLDPYSESIDRAVARLRDFDPEQDREIAELLPGELNDWLGEFLVALRQGGTDKALEYWLTPHMDRLWDDYLGDTLRKSLDQQVAPPPDPGQVAATINGMPVPKFLVRQLRDQHRAELRRLPLPEPDDARPWTQDPALAAAIRAVLVAQHARRAAGDNFDEAIDDMLNSSFPDLAEKDDPDWIKTTGLSRQEFGQWARTLTLVNQWLKQLEANVEDPADEQVLRDHFEKHPRLFRHRFAFSMVFSKPASVSPRDVTRCHRLVSETADLPGHGLSLPTLRKLNEGDKGCECLILSQTGLDASAIPLPILRILERLDTDGLSESIEIGKGVAVVGLQSIKPDPALDFANVRQAVLAHWKAEQTEVAAAHWLAVREAGADIKVVGDSGGALENPPAQSAFDELLARRADSMLGLTGCFWNRVIIHDREGAEAALDRLVEKRRKDAARLVFLFHPLIDIERNDLAKACLQKAAEGDPMMTRINVGNLLRQHAGHNEGKGCPFYHTLKEASDEALGMIPAHPVPGKPGKTGGSAGQSASRLAEIAYLMDGPSPELEKDLGDVLKAIDEAIRFLEDFKGTPEELRRQIRPSPAPAETNSGEAAATVNGSVITKDDLAKMLAPVAYLLANAHPRDGEQYRTKLEEARNQALDYLIERKIVTDYLAGRGITIPDDLIVKDAERIYHDESGGDPEELGRQLELAGWTPAAFYEERKNTVLMEALKKQLSKDTPPVTPAEIEARYKEQGHEMRDRSKDEITFRKIFIPIAPDGTPGTPKAQQELAEALAEELRQGASFEALAKEHSEGHKAKEGGLWSDTPRWELSRGFAECLFSSKPDTIVGPIADPRGFTIAKVTEIKPAPAPPLNDKLRGMLRGQIETARQGKRLRQWMLPLAKAATIKRIP